MPHRALAQIRCFLCIQIKDTSVSASQDGFSVTEALVAIAIITILGVQTVVSFSSLREQAPLRQGVRELAFQIRKIQTAALSVVILPDGQPANRIGLQLQQDATSYTIFGDTNNNGKPDSGIDYTPPPFSFPHGVKIDDIQVIGGAPNPPKAQVVFNAPEAAVIFYTTAADETVTKEVNATQIEIVLIGSQGTRRTVRVSAAGQITIPQ